MFKDFETTGTLTNKVFMTLTPDNPKLSGLGTQLVDMENDFDDMKRAMDEAKRRIEEKFDDVYNEINKTKEFVIEQGISTNNTIKHFRETFEKRLAALQKEFQAQHDEFIAREDEGFKDVEIRSKYIEEKIIEEKEERIRSWEAEMKPIREALIFLEEDIKTQTAERIVGEKNMLKKIEEESKRVDKDIQDEKKNCTDRLTTVTSDIEHHRSQAEALTLRFYDKTKQELVHVTTGLEKEMDNRFDHQDKAVDRLSVLVGSFQATLKVLGKEV